MIFHSPVTNDSNLIRRGADELNMCEFPFALLSERPNPNITELTYHDTPEFQGKRINRRWTIRGGAGIGLPTAWDESLYVILMEKTMEMGFSSRTIPFTRYELLQRLGWEGGRSGRGYQTIEDGLDRLHAVQIKTETAFTEERGKMPVSTRFHILSKAETEDVRSGRGPKINEESYITWDETLWESIATRKFYKPLDVKFYLSLTSWSGRRLYRYLDKKNMHPKEVWCQGLTKLAYEKIGVSRNRKFASQVKDELHRGHMELILKGFLHESEVIRVKQPDGSYIEEPDISYAAMTDDPFGLKAVYRFTKKISKLSRHDKDIYEILVSMGVERARAGTMVSNHREACEHQINYLPFWDIPVRDKAAWLVTAVSRGFEAPNAYIAEMERRKKSNLISQETAKEAEASRLRTERAERFLAALSPQEIESWTATAMSRLSSFGRSVVKDNASHRLVGCELRKMALDALGESD